MINKFIKETINKKIKIIIIVGSSQRTEKVVEHER